MKTEDQPPVPPPEPPAPSIRRILPGKQPRAVAAKIRIMIEIDRAKRARAL